MSAICGYVARGSRYPADQAVARMLASQDDYGPDHKAVAGAADAAVGRALYRLLPEDEFDTQPLRSEDGRLLLVADLRLDNRDALLRELGASAGDARRMSDAAILLAALLRWGEEAIARLSGDFALALWRTDERRLTLARDPLGQRPLHYHAGDDFFAFSTMPRGLHALDNVPRRANRSRVAEWVSDVPFTGNDSYFEGVSRVEPGHIATFDGGGVRSRAYWSPRRGTLRLPSREAYVEAFREQLDRATQARLRRNRGGVGAYLSSGWDSSAVAATAARLLAPEGARLLALTAAPREGFAGPALRGRIADESGLAAQTASLYPNLDHVVRRPTGRSPFELLDRFSDLFEQPTGHLCNHVWISDLLDTARAGGVSVLLSGAMGNYTISAGGAQQLADLVRERRWGSWLREARALVRRGVMSWPGVLDNSVGPWAPTFLYRQIKALLLKSSRRSGEPFLVAPAWRPEMARRLDRSTADIRPPRDSFAIRAELLRGGDAGNFNKGKLAGWGIDERDPTADTQLVEFCLSLPHEMLLKDGIRRPLARSALADRLPAAVLDAPLRGVQMADWYEHFGAAEARAEVDRLGRVAAVCEVVDLPELRRVIDRWPTGGWNEPRVVREYRMDVLRTIAGAHFLSRADGAAKVEGAGR